MNKYILIISVLLLVDSLYNLYYFKYNYLKLIKNRFIRYNEINIKLKEKLYNEDKNYTKIFIQFLVLPWAVMISFTKYFFILAFVSIFTYLVNNFNKKTYIAPEFVLLNEIILIISYTYIILNILNIINI
jgi:hypothetical protein